jgi:uncharacterized membrane protein
MGSKLRLAGHPLHPLLVHFPVALWTIAVFAELGGWAMGRDWWAISFGCQALGVLGAVVAMVPGFFDFVALPRSHPAVDTATFHLLAMSGAWLMFIASLALRGLPATAAPPLVATTAAGAGFVFMAIGGWLGGRLVYRFGVGVSSTQRS